MFGIFINFYKKLLGKSGEYQLKVKIKKQRPKNI